MHAQTWTGVVDGDWTNPGNWDPNTAVPVSGGLAVFNGPRNGNTMISLAGAAQPINTVEFDAGAAAYTIGQLSGDALNFDSGGAIVASSGLANGQTINAAIQTNNGLSVINAVANGVTTGNGLIGLTLGPINLAGGLLQLNNSTQTAVTTVFNGNITETPGQPGSLLLLATTGGTGNNSNVVINGNNSYTGGTTIQVNTGTNGGIYVGSDTAFGTGKINNLQQNNVDELRALNGTRTIANSIDLNGGINFSGTNGFVFTGNWTIASSTSRTLRNKITGGASVTIGANDGSSVFYLGNPADSVATARTLILATETGASTILNAAIRDVANSVPGTVQLSAASGNGVTLVNSVSTYTGPTLLGGGANVIVQFNHSYNTGDTAGPFGLGTFTFNNDGTLQPVGGDRTLINPIVLGTAQNSNLKVSNATADTSGLTLTGTIMTNPTNTTANRSIANNFGATGGVLTLGSAGSPSAITLPNATGQTLTISGTGRTVINDTIQDSPGIPTTITINNTATTTFNGPLNINGILQLSGGSAGHTTTAIINGNLTSSGELRTTGDSNSAAKVLVVNGVKSGNGAVTINGTGTLAGIGSLDGAVTNNGTIAPGTPPSTPGPLTLTGNVIDGASSHWLIVLAGTTSGKLIIGGNLDLSAADSLDVAGTGTGPWVIATYGTLTGTFDTVTAGYMVDYGSPANPKITLTLAGDYNGDGKVDAADYVSLRKTNPDITSGAGLAVYNTWQQNFGAGTSGSGANSAVAATVPEPCSLLLLAMALACLPFCNCDYVKSRHTPSKGE